MQRFCRLRRQTPLLVRSMNIEETRVLELRRQAVHGSGAAPGGWSFRTEGWSGHRAERGVNLCPIHLRPRIRRTSGRSI